jgi:hypothetical protein
MKGIVKFWLTVNEYSMKDEDLEKLVKMLQGVDVQLPLHEKTLRERLLEMHASDTDVRRRSLTTAARTIIASKKLLSVGVAVILAGVIVVALLVFLPAGSTTGPAKRLMAGAAQGIWTPAASNVEVGGGYRNLNNQSQNDQSPANRGDDAKPQSAPIPEVRGTTAVPATMETPAPNAPAPNRIPPGLSIAFGDASDPLLSIEAGNQDDHKKEKDEDKDKEKDKEDDKPPRESGLLHGLLEGLVSVLE